jgi:hypothetical protein
VDGRVVPSSYIYMAGRHLLGWHAGMHDTEQATFARSTNDWTDNEQELDWVVQNFEKYTIKMFVPFD